MTQLNNLLQHFLFAWSSNRYTSYALVLNLNYFVITFKRSLKLVDWLENIRDELLWVLSVGAAKWFHFSLSSDDDLDEWEIGKSEVWQQLTVGSWHKSHHSWPKHGCRSKWKSPSICHRPSQLFCPIIRHHWTNWFSPKVQTIYNLIHLK